MGKSIVDLIFDFSIPWFWIAFGIIIFLFLIWLLLVHEFKILKSDDITSPVLLLAIYLLTSSLYAAVYIQSVRKEPAFDFGFYLSILIATLLFYMSGLLAIFFLIFSMMKISSTRLFFRYFILFIYFFALWLLAYSIGYSSPSGVFLSILQFISCMWQTKLVGKFKESDKPKTE